MSLVRPVIVLLLLAACTTETVYVDPEIEISDDYFIEPVAGDPTVILGFYSEQLFYELKNDDDCPVVWGLQGGTWTMPAIRTIGIGSRPTVNCTLVTINGELVGEVKAKTAFFLSPDGYLEYQSFPIPVAHEDNDDPIDDLYNQKAELTCAVSDDQGRGDTQSVSVTITDG